MRISQEKIDKISEQILMHLYSNNPQPFFTAHIAREMARDEEFIKKLMVDLKKRKLVIEIKKNSQGLDYIRRSRWKLSNETYHIYSQKQI